MICKKCGHFVGDNAEFCANCGTKAKGGNSKNHTSIFRKWWFWLIVVFAVLIIGSASGEDDSNNAESSGNTSVSQNSSQNNEGTNNASTTEKPSVSETTVPPETTAPSTTAKTYSSGMYKVGTEIDPGEYFVIADSFLTAYVQVSSDSSGTIDSIISNSNFSTFSFITVEDGQYLTVKRGTFVKAEDATVPGPDSDGNYCEGMYRVGIDIPAGEYKITPESGQSAYIEVAEDSFGVINSIISNENTKDPFYISAAAGQYLKVDRGQFIIVG